MKGSCGASVAGPDTATISLNDAFLVRRLLASENLLQPRSCWITTPSTRTKMKSADVKIK